MTKCRETALDLTQDTFLRANQYFREDQILNEKSWVLGIARNVFFTYAKKAARESTGSILPDTADSRPSFVDEIQWQLLRKRIVSSLESEKAILVEIFILRMDLGLSHEEIAKITGIPLRTIRRNFEKIRVILLRDFRHELEINLDIK